MPKVLLLRMQTTIYIYVLGNFHTKNFFSINDKYLLLAQNRISNEKRKNNSRKFTTFSIIDYKTFEMKLILLFIYFQVCRFVWKIQINYYYYYFYSLLKIHFMEIVEKYCKLGFKKNVYRSF